MKEPDYEITWDVDDINDYIDAKQGYRYIYYDSTCNDVKKHVHGNIRLLGYDKEGNRIDVKVSEFPSTVWTRDPLFDEGTDGWVDAYGQPVVRKSFDNAAERRSWMRKWKSDPDYAEKQIVKADIPETEFAKEVFTPYAQTDDFNKGKFRTFFLDIENEISGAFMPPYMAKNRINMITVFDTETETFYTWSLKECDVSVFDKDPYKHVVYDHFSDDERGMLKHFLAFWVDNYPDVVCGWNSYAYDIPYIVRRFENLFGQVVTAKLSPFGEYRICHERTDEVDPETGKQIEKEEISNVEIPGISQLDELLLYRGKFQVKQALDGGYTLNNVGIAEELGEKVHYDDTLKDLYEHDWQKFYEYNVRDVDLLYAIEKKCKLIPASRTIAGFGLNNYEVIYQSVAYIVDAIDIYCLKNRDHVLFNTYNNNFVKKVPYEGAFVFDPVPGRYSDGVCCVDFNSLYPSCMRMLNLSVETYVGRLELPRGEAQWLEDGGVDGLDDEAQYTFIQDRNDMPTPVKKYVTKDTIKKMLAEKCIICAPNCTFFFKHEIKRGVMADWAGFFFDKRKAVKKAMKTEKDPEVLENLDTMQYAIKILINSAYGTLAAGGCPWSHPIALAQSVTRAGRFANINGAKFYNQYLKENYNISDDFITTVSGDTDSNFFNIGPIKDSFAKQHGWDSDINRWEDDQKLKLWGFLENYVEVDLVPKIQSLIAKEFCSGNTWMMRYGLEYLGSGGIYEGKKHYMVHIVVDDKTAGGHVTDKFKATGIAVKKAEVPPEIKKFLKEIYQTAILDASFNESKFLEKLDEVYNEICRMDANKLGLWKGYNTEKKMVKFLVSEKGGTGISQPVGFYNQIISDMQIGKLYDTIELGDKAQIVYVNPANEYGIKYIAFKPRKWPAEFDKVFEIDYPTMFQKLVLGPLGSFCKALKFARAEKYNPSIAHSLAYDVDDI